MARGFRVYASGCEVGSCVRGTFTFEGCPRDLFRVRCLVEELTMPSEGMEPRDRDCRTTNGLDSDSGYPGIKLGICSSGFRNLGASGHKA